LYPSLSRCRLRAVPIIPVPPVISTVGIYYLQM
jgi:hypothetical protein